MQLGMSGLPVALGLGSVVVGREPRAAFAAFGGVGPVGGMGGERSSRKEKHECRDLSLTLATLGEAALLQKHMKTMILDGKHGQIF